MSVRRRYIAALAVVALASPAVALPPLEDIVMYEANIRAMSVEGDLGGVTARLDDIASLGVNVIWLMPVTPIGQDRPAGALGSPYAPREHRAVDPEYGTLDDLCELVDEADARGISVILDWVTNHTAWDHPWITTNPEWYSTNALGEIIHPPGTNWLDVADLNYDNADMRAAMIDSMVWWVQSTGIDGFRMDAPDFVPFEFWSEAIESVRASVERPLLMFAEGARADHYDAGFDLTFGWRFYYGLKPSIIDGQPAREIARAHDEEYSLVPEGKRVLRWTTNHDETAYDAPPPVLFGSLEAAQAAYASMIAYGATPLIYSGQEVGTTVNTPVLDKLPIEWTLNPSLPAWYASVIGIRQQHDALKSGAITDRSSNDALIVARTLGDERVLAMVNLRNQTTSTPIPQAWSALWTDLGAGLPRFLEGQRTLAPYGIEFYRLDTWPTFVVAGALQTEQGDPSDWDVTQSTLHMSRDSAIYTLNARNLAPGIAYAFEVVSDRGLPPINADDPRVATNVRAMGDADGVVTITLDDTHTNNTGGPVVWVDTDGAPLHVVGNFMDEMGGNADWNPADSAFAMTPLGQGRYVFAGAISTPATYTFKATYGGGWNDQVGTDGFNNNALVQEFVTASPDQPVKLFVDLREQRLEAWTAPCSIDRDGNLRLDVFDLLDVLRWADAGVPNVDVLGFIRELESGCH
ncbi:MAG: alpha-amylase family glycosyl hydrolase [Planctomycetota bacterium]